MRAERSSQDVGWCRVDRLDTGLVSVGGPGRSRSATVINTQSTSIAFVLTVLVAASLGSTPTQAQSARAEFEVSGTSTVRGWTCPVAGVVEAPPGQSSAPLPGFPNGVGSVTITVQVQDFDCPEEEMNEHLLEAMEASTHPEIVVELQEYSLTGETAEASGTITIHGVTGPITLGIELVESSEGVRGVGETAIDMTEFDVTPPSVFLGLLNVGEVVTIEFDAPLPSSE